MVKMPSYSTPIFSSGPTHIESRDDLPVVVEHPDLGLRTRQSGLISSSHHVSRGDSAPPSTNDALCLSGHRRPRWRASRIQSRRGPAQWPAAGRPSFGDRLPQWVRRHPMSTAVRAADVTGMPLMVCTSSSRDGAALSTPPRGGMAVVVNQFCAGLATFDPLRTVQHRGGSGWRRCPRRQGFSQTASAREPLSPDCCRATALRPGRSVVYRLRSAYGISRLAANLGAEKSHLGRQWTIRGAEGTLPTSVKPVREIGRETAAVSRSALSTVSSVGDGPELGVQLRA